MIAIITTIAVIVALIVPIVLTAATVAVSFLVLTLILLLATHLVGIGTQTMTNHRLVERIGAGIKRGICLYFKIDFLLS